MVARLVPPKPGDLILIQIRVGGYSIEKKNLATDRHRWERSWHSLPGQFWELAWQAGHLGNSQRAIKILGMGSLQSGNIKFLPAILATGADFLRI
jgi:hypothetical protein